ncbi:hypothetical protein [Brasilonema sp. UFV-L1]|uniref:hypothetical protein n=1 Tax=Brasilonema sp. UFV-L1 TaxID=2234130 RepID=UPI00145C9717|nr:hypothetical protein [Brasilonema sp. UFV-L1]
MTKDKDQDQKTYVTPEGNFVTDDYGRQREATPEEIEATVNRWEQETKGDEKTKSS